MGIDNYSTLLKAKGSFLGVFLMWQFKFDFT